MLSYMDNHTLHKAMFPVSITYMVFCLFVCLTKLDERYAVLNMLASRKIVRLIRMLKEGVHVPS